MEEKYRDKKFLVKVETRTGVKASVVMYWRYVMKLYNQHISTEIAQLLNKGEDYKLNFHAKSVLKSAHFICLD